MKAKNIQKLSTVIACLMFFGNGCVNPIVKTPVIQPATQKIIGPKIQELSDVDVAWIARNIDAATMPQGVGQLSNWLVPDGISSAQFRNAYLLTEGTAFGIVQQPNSNLPLLNDDGTLYQGPISFAGLLFTQDNGQNWKYAFSIPTSTLKDEQNNPVHLNVGGLFYHKGQYALDVVDDRGAGSGEGNLTRFWTKDGKTWQQDKNCYYFIPEKYYNHEQGLRSKLAPPGGFDPIFEKPDLKIIKCPEYFKKINK